VYEAPHKDDGTRILVDRLWPRGLTKERAKVDLWLKEIAPSTELRKWFGHDPKKWRSFRERYETELKDHADQLKLLKSKVKEGTVTLIYGARDQELPRHAKRSESPSDLSTPPAAPRRIQASPRSNRSCDGWLLARRQLGRILELQRNMLFEKHVSRMRLDMLGALPRKG